MSNNELAAIIVYFPGSCLQEESYMSKNIIKYSKYTLTEWHFWVGGLVWCVPCRGSQNVGGHPDRDGTFGNGFPAFYNGNIR